MTHIPYEGKTLKSRNLVFWQVRIWDENGVEGPWSDMASFEMGLMAQSDWKADWMTGDYAPKKKERYPVDCFKSTFTIAKENIKKARLYVAACRISHRRVAVIFTCIL